MRNVFISLLILYSAIQGISQENILNNHYIQQKIERCLAATYNFNFSEAISLQQEIKNQIPQHPVTPFLEALIIYWENFPLLPEDPSADNFLSSMQKSIKYSKAFLKEDSQSTEGVFFELHARAYMAMFWADNGRPSRVIMEIDKLYKRTMQGIDMKKKFNEFYFSSGLYSYYIEAYVELHPIYKPIAILFKTGDKERGLKEMQYAIDNTTYIKAESLLFMSLLQLNYEKQLDQALEYASVLYKMYPENIYYIGHYLKILVYQDKFDLANEVLQRLDKKENKFSSMIHVIMQGFITENDLNKLKEARSLYREGIEMAEKFGPFADIYQAIAFAGLSRISSKRGNTKLARKYKRMSSSFKNYEFILNYD